MINDKPSLDSLAHYGVKGMKWGVRRYLNKDGSLTNEGRKRYANVSDEWTNPNRKYLPSDNMLKSMPRKERSATKKFMKDVGKNNRKVIKEDYKTVKKDKNTFKDYKAYNKGKNFIENNAELYSNANSYKRLKKERIEYGMAYTFASGILGLSVASAIGTRYYKK